MFPQPSPNISALRAFCFAGCFRTVLSITPVCLDWPLDYLPDSKTPRSVTVSWKQLSLEHSFLFVCFALLCQRDGIRCTPGQQGFLLSTVTQHCGAVGGLQTQSHLLFPESIPLTWLFLSLCNLMYSFVSIYTFLRGWDCYFWYFY